MAVPQVRQGAAKKDFLCLFLGFSFSSLLGKGKVLQLQQWDELEQGDSLQAASKVNWYYLFKVLGFSGNLVIMSGWTVRWRTHRGGPTEEGEQTAADVGQVGL